MFLSLFLFFFFFFLNAKLLESPTGGINRGGIGSESQTSKVPRTRRRQKRTRHLGTGCRATAESGEITVRLIRNRAEEAEEETKEGRGLTTKETERDEREERERRETPAWPRNYVCTSLRPRGLRGWLRFLPVCAATTVYYASRSPCASAYLVYLFFYFFFLF
ncbi:hypothetical protein PUN28_016225 [Cardiocondyla obscurior]|uniref:Uncharacterized protein n=1 Tax=Cardiocondyla obscurior TaxID=286306 RepID=A0AAW2ET92_9HYME